MLETDVDSFIVRFVHVRGAPLRKEVREAELREAELHEAELRNAELRNAQGLNLNNRPTAAPWHGIIRHVQSKEEIRFTQIEDALRFVANYVALTDDDLAQHHHD